jgi:hypothetical protein
MTTWRTFENDGKPIEDLFVALDLLKPWRGDNTTRELFRGRIAKETGPFLEVGHHHDFGDSRWHRYLVAPAVVSELVAQHLVHGKKHWGYTDENVLSISEHGERTIWDERKRLQAPHYQKLYGWAPPPAGEAKETSE